MANLVDRANKIREEVRKMPPEITQEHKLFFDEVWNFCGAVIDESEQGTSQFVPDPLI